MSYILECLNNILALMNKKLLWFYFIIIIIIFFVSSVTSERKRDLNARTKISNVYTHKTAARLSDLNWLLRRIATRKNILSNGLFNGAFQEEINYLQSSSIPKKTRFLRIDSRECIYGEKSFVSLCYFHSNLFLLFSKSRFKRCGLSNHDDASR